LHGNYVRLGFTLDVHETHCMLGPCQFIRSMSISDACLHS